MTIHGKLRLFVSLAALLIGIFTSLLVTYSLQVRHELQQAKAMDEFARSLFDLNSLVTQYVDKNSHHDLLQWKNIHMSARNILVALEGSRSGRDIARISMRYDHIEKLFEKLVEASQRTYSDNKNSLLQGMQQQLVSQISISQNVLLSEVDQWHERFYSNLIITQQRIFIMIFSLAITMALLVVSSVFLLTKSVLRPVMRLKKAMQNIGLGSFPERITTKPKNEIGDLTDDFNNMVERLHQTTLSRDQLVEEAEQRRLIENELRRFEDIVNHMQVGLFVYHLKEASQTASLCMVHVNTSALKMTNRKREELMGKPIFECFPSLSNTPIPEIYARLARSSSTAELGEIEYSDQHVKHAWYSVWAFGLPDHHVGVIFEDITFRKESEIQERHAQKLEAVGQLASGIAHEINTPVQFVGDNLEFFKGSTTDIFDLIQKYQALFDDPEQLKLIAENPDQIREINEEADLDYLSMEVPKAIGQSLDGLSRVAAIVRAMKEFAHQSNDEFTLTDLNKAIRNTMTISRNEWKYNANIRTEIDEELPMVLCNAGGINQVILNLIINAAHAIKDAVSYTPDQKGTITISSSHDDHFVTLSIADTGSGIPKEIQHKIFDPFFTTKEVGKGTGQGLALAHKIIKDQHHGTLTFESEEGKGTVFYIRLPINQDT